MSEKSMRDALEKVCKWRKFFASWQLGTTAENSGAYKAVANQRELFILLRVEVNAFTTLLLEKGVFTQQEFMDAVEKEAVLLNGSYEEEYAGITAGPDGLTLRFPLAQTTMKRLGFPP